MNPLKENAWLIGIKLHGVLKSKNVLTKISANTLPFSNNNAIPGYSKMKNNVSISVISPTASLQEKSHFNFKEPSIFVNDDRNCCARFSSILDFFQNILLNKNRPCLNV